MWVSGLSPSGGAARGRLCRSPPPPPPPHAFVCYLLDPLLQCHCLLSGCGRIKFVSVYLFSLCAFARRGSSMGLSFVRCSEKEQHCVVSQNHGFCRCSGHHHIVSPSFRSDLLISSVRQRNCPGNRPTAQPSPSETGRLRRSPGGNRSPKYSWFYQTATRTASPRSITPLKSERRRPKWPPQMRQTDKSLQSEKFKQEVSGLGKPQGKCTAPDRIQSPRDLHRSFPCWPGSGYFGTARGGVLSTAEGPRLLQLWDPRPPHSHLVA